MTEAASAPRFLRAFTRLLPFLRDKILQETVPENLTKNEDDIRSEFDRDQVGRFLPLGTTNETAAIPMLRVERPVMTRTTFVRD